jgi:aminopeptidase N
MAEGSGDPAVIEAFESFVNQPGVPLVNVATAADGSLKLSQSRYRPLGPAAHSPDILWKIPFCADFYGAAQPSKLCTMLSAANGTLSVPASLKGAIVHPNAHGAGYYRFTVDATLWQSLLSMGPRLPAREAMTLADSASAAFDAGRLPFAGLFQAAQVLAGHPDRTTALTLGYRLQSLHDRLATPAERVLLERALVSLYGKRLQQLGYDPTPGRYAAEPADQQLLRRELITLVGGTGRDPRVRAALAPVAERSVAAPDSIESLLRWRIWAIGMRERGSTLFAPLRNLALNSADAQVRQDASLALGFAETPAVVNEALALSLDPELKMPQALAIMSLQLQDPVSRETAWPWLAAHRDAAVGRLPAMSQADFANLGDLFCDASGRQAFNSVLGAKLRPLNGGELTVDRVLENIDECMALRAAVGNSMTSALQQALH